MVLRMEVRGVSVLVAPDGAAETPPLGLYFSTSALVMRPPSPVPLISLMGIPFSRASCLARGEIAVRLPRSRTVSRRPPLEVGSSDFVSVGAGFGGSEDSEASSFGGGGALDSPPALSTVKSAKASTSALSSTRMAMG